MARLGTSPVTVLPRPRESEFATNASNPDTSRLPAPTRLASIWLVRLLYHASIHRARPGGTLSHWAMLLAMIWSSICSFSSQPMIKSRLNSQAPISNGFLFVYPPAKLISQWYQHLRRIVLAISYLPIPSMGRKIGFRSVRRVEWLAGKRDESTLMWYKKCSCSERQSTKAIFFSAWS